MAKFSTSAYVVAAHGAGLVNMVFMHPGTTVVEVRPANFEVPVFDRSAASLGVHHRVLRAGTGRWRGPLKIDARSLLAYVREVVENGTTPAAVYTPGADATGAATGAATAAGASSGASTAAAGTAGSTAPATGP